MTFSLIEVYRNTPRTLIDYMCNTFHLNYPFTIQVEIKTVYNDLIKGMFKVVKYNGSLYILLVGRGVGTVVNPFLPYNTNFKRKENTYSNP